MSGYLQEIRIVMGLYFHNKILKEHYGILLL